MLEWLKRHAWKACKRQKRFGGSNPPLSARTDKNMKRLFFLFTLIGLLSFTQLGVAQNQVDSVATTDTTAITADVDSMAVMVENIDEMADDEAEGGLHKQLKTKFVDGNVAFMSLVALALVLGLAFCIERIIYLTLSEIKTHQLMGDIEQKLKANDVEGAKDLCRNTRGPVASVCYQGLLHIKQPMDAIERSITNFGGLQTANLEKGCSWIKLFIAYRHGTISWIPWYGDRYGDGFRPDSDCWRYWSHRSSPRYEGSTDHDYLRYCCGIGAAAVLQLYPL